MSLTVLLFFSAIGYSVITTGPEEPVDLLLEDPMTVEETMQMLEEEFDKEDFELESVTVEDFGDLENLGNELEEEDLEYNSEV